MTSMTRFRMARCLGALIGAVALGAALPAPALADHRDHGERGHRHDRDHDHERGLAYRRGGVVARLPRLAPAPPRWRGGHRPDAPAYTCSRCRAHFASYQGLYGHVNHHHRIPTWQVPRVLAQVSFGWTFGF